jgi:hypothetical protein
MRLQLARDVPLALNLEFGAGESDLDLTGLRVTNMDLQSATARSPIRLPESAKAQADDLWRRRRGRRRDSRRVVADILVSGGVGNRKVDQVRFRSLGGGHYRSFDYETAANRVEPIASLGVGSVDRQILAKTRQSREHQFSQWLASAFDGPLPAIRASLSPDEHNGARASPESSLRTEHLSGYP